MRTNPPSNIAHNLRWYELAKMLGAGSWMFKKRNIPLVPGNCCGANQELTSWKSEQFLNYWPDISPAEAHDHLRSRD
jgi:hypothetical protein